MTSYTQLKTMDDVYALQPGRILNVQSDPDNIAASFRRLELNRWETIHDVAQEAYPDIVFPGRLDTDDSVRRSFSRVIDRGWLVVQDEDDEPETVLV